MEIKEILMHEMDTLREELQHLKNCQVRYFLFSITITASILGILSKLNRVDNLGFLTPLLIILPCWWIFFDKASTITRIVGYYRQLEKMILAQGDHRYLGWEQSLSEFRKWQEEGKFVDLFNSKDSESKKTFKLLQLQTAHRYWVINWYTFLALSVTCLFLGAFPLGYINTGVSGILAIVVVFSAIKLFRDISKLVFGTSSYNANEIYWEKVLEVSVAPSSNLVTENVKNVPSPTLEDR